MCILLSIIILQDYCFALLIDQIFHCIHDLVVMSFQAPEPMQVDDGSDGEVSDTEEPSIVENSSLVGVKLIC